MKKLLILSIMALAMVSCGTSSTTTEIQQPTLDAETKSVILSTLEEQLTEEMGFPFKYESSEVIKIKKQYYLRARSSKYVTTTLLGINKDMALFNLGVSCTSSSCAQSTTECVPKWVGNVPTCTKCTQGTKDCKRTVSGS